MLTRIDHVGIACDDLDEKISFYSEMFGIVPLSREINLDQGVEEAMLRVNDGSPAGSYVQLLRPTAPDTPVGRFLARRGEGIHHIAYGVDDVAAALRELEAKGVRLIDTTPRHGALGSSIGFLHPSGVGGVLTELVQATEPLT